MTEQTAGALGSVLLHYFSLDQEDHCGSVRLLSDLLIANAGPLELCIHGDQYYKVLVHYADSLYFDLQFRRALRTYQQALMVCHKQESEFKETAELLQTECDLKWKMYKCHLKLKELQEAFDMLTSIPLKQRDSKVALALGRLYHRFKNESREAKICYKQALSSSPLALEAAVALLNLGMSLPEICHAAQPLHTKEESGPLSPGSWLYSWLEFQAYIAKHDFSGAVSKVGAMSQQGFVVSAETHCQLARCKAKLGQTDSAKELFARALTMEPHLLTHMDTYSRLLTSKSELEKLSTTLLYSSCHHHQPWLARVWQLTKSSSNLFNAANVTPLMQKADSIEPKNAETTFLQGTLLRNKKDTRGAVKKFMETIQIDLTFFEAFEYIVRLYLDMGCDKEAFSLLRTTAKKLPTSRQLFLEGLALSRQNTTKAKLSLERAVRTEPSFEKAVLELSQLFVSEGNAGKAVEILTNHLRLYETPSLHCELGTLLSKQSHYMEAEEQFRQALRLDSTLKRACDGLMRVTQFQADQGYEGDNVGSDESVQELDLSSEQYDPEWIG